MFTKVLLDFVFLVCSHATVPTTQKSDAPQLYYVSPFHQGQGCQTWLGPNVSETQGFPIVMSGRHPVSEHLQTNSEAIKKAH